MSWSPRSYAMNGGTNGMGKALGGVDSALAKPAPGAGLPIEKDYGEGVCKVCRVTFHKATWNQRRCQEHLRSTQRLQRWNP